MAEITPPPQRGSVLELDGYTGAWVQQPQRGSVLELDGYLIPIKPGFRNWTTGSVAFTENAK